MCKMRRLDLDRCEWYKDITPFWNMSHNNKSVVLIPIPTPKDYHSFRRLLNGDETNCIDQMIGCISEGIMSVEDKDCKMSLAAEWILQSLAKDHKDEITSVVKKLCLSIIMRFSPETAVALMARISWCRDAEMACFRSEYNSQGAFTWKPYIPWTTCTLLSHGIKVNTLYSATTTARWYDCTSPTEHTRAHPQHEHHHPNHSHSNYFYNVHHHKKNLFVDLWTRTPYCSLPILQTLVPAAAIAAIVHYITIAMAIERMGDTAAMSPMVVIHPSHHGEATEVVVSELVDGMEWPGAREDGWWERVCHYQNCGGCCFVVIQWACPAPDVFVEQTYSTLVNFKFLVM